MVELSGIEAAKRRGEALDQGPESGQLDCGRTAMDRSRFLARLVGPMFVVGEVLMALGLMSPMRMAIERQAGPTR